MVRNFQNKRGFRNILQSKPVLVFLSILLLVFAWGVFSFMSKMRVTIENRKIVENKVAELEKTKERLSSDIAKLKSQDGVEESIRQKFGLAKEGEGVIVVMDDKNPPEIEKKESGGFFSWLRNLFR